MPRLTARSSSDLDYCRGLLRQGSKSFYVASRLLPSDVEQRVVPLYAFCRVADDLIDEVVDPGESFETLRARVDSIHAGSPWSHPVDRAFADVVMQSRLPRRVTLALLEGFAWEVDGRRYHTLSDVRAYATRVAATVGVMVTMIMDRRDRETLARAADLGVAMQLTNIARDVGEDARNGRVYLPEEWIRGEGVNLEEWLKHPHFDPALGRVVRRLLLHADTLYARAASGIPRLPMDCRIAIEAARLIYADIGRVIAQRRYDSVSHRAVTSPSRKAWLGIRASAALSRPLPVDRRTASLKEAAFLVDAVTESDESARSSDHEPMEEAC